MWAFAIGWLTVLGRNTSLESIQQFPVLQDTCKTNNCKILQAEKSWHFCLHILSFGVNWWVGTSDDLNFLFPLVTISSLFLVKFNFIYSFHNQQRNPFLNGEIWLYLNFNPFTKNSLCSIWFKKAAGVLLPFTGLSLNKLNVYIFLIL